MTNLIQDNLDIDGLIQRGEDVANKTMSYNKKSLRQDLTILIEAIRNMTVFNDGEVPKALRNPELWTDDAVSFLDSAWNRGNIDFTV